MSECVFCNLLTGKLPSSIVYQDELCTAFMDVQPVNQGHVLVVPNNHVPYLSDLHEEVGAHLFKIAQRIAAALRKSGIKCEGINVFLADGEIAGQEIFHVHLHVFPRFRGDKFGFIWSSAISHIPERAELDTVAGLLREVL